jgi:hypothetical protein
MNASEKSCECENARDDDQPKLSARRLGDEVFRRTDWIQSKLGPLRGGRLSLLFARSKERPKRKSQQLK